MQRICVLVLLGLPAAGKTTFSRWLFAQSLSHNIVHLCYDDHYTPHTTATPRGEFNFKLQRLDILKLLETIVHSIKKTSSPPAALKNQINILLQKDSGDFVIICDDNNYYRSMRYQLLQLCRTHRLAYAQIYFETNLQLALTRNERRMSDKLPPHVIEQMCAKLEAPDSQQHPWEAMSLILNGADAYTSETVISFIAAAFNNVQKPAPLKVSTETELANFVHQLDLLLRRRIGELLVVNSTTTTKQARALALNARRKEILHDFKEAHMGDWNADDLMKYVDLLH